MSNLSITTQCNNKCAYCFSDDSKLQYVNDEDFMQLEVFNSAIAFLERSGIKQIRILGGEPTLHPLLCNMIEIGVNKGFHILLFSNGLISKDIIEKFFNIDREHFTLLLNAMGPNENNTSGFLKQQRTMELLGNRVKLGVNIFNRSQQLDHLIDNILKYGLKRELRLGIAHPLQRGTNKYLHPKYYKEVGLKIYELHKNAQRSGITIDFDCGFVPCMFPETFYDKLGPLLLETGKSCGPIPDLLPNGNFIPCFPLSIVKQFKLNAHITSKQVAEIFEHKLTPFADFGIYPECNNCALFKEYCQGGCISHKILRLQNKPYKDQPESKNKVHVPIEKLQPVLNMFDVNSRIPPKPYTPKNNSEILNEKEILGLINNDNLQGDLSIYIHIPFCSTKCTFCDLYSFAINDRNRYLLEAYVNSIIKEAKYWGAIAGHKYAHVTTVHFGGGSPMSLSKIQISRILDTLRKYFNIDLNTEIAVEVRTDELTNTNFTYFKNENISRIHIGLQTLNLQIRKLIGRSDSISDLTSKIGHLKNSKAITSVDLLYALPNQPEDGLITDIDYLYQLGVDGFALYEFQPSKFIAKSKTKGSFFLPNKYESFMQFINAQTLLNSLGYDSVFFNHYGNCRDKNLYFTFQQRLEDCISLGSISDGVIGRIHFRHLPIKKYLNSVGQDGCGIDFGYLESESRSLKKSFEISLMSTKISSNIINEFKLNFGNNFSKIFNEWNENGLLSSNAEEFRVSAVGGFFISNMIEQIRTLNKN